MSDAEMKNTETVVDITDENERIMNRICTRAQGCRGEQLTEPVWTEEEFEEDYEKTDADVNNISENMRAISNIWGEDDDW